MTLLDSVLLGAATGVVGTAGGFVLGRIAAQRLRRELDAARADTSRAEAQGREQARQIHRMRNEQRWLSNLSRYLPNVVRELNRSDIDARQIPRLVISLVDAIFEPEQITMYQVRNVGEGESKDREMFLTDHRGLEAMSVPRRIHKGVRRAREDDGVADYRLGDTGISAIGDGREAAGIIGRDRR